MCCAHGSFGLDCCSVPSRLRFMDKMTTGRARMIRRASSGTNGLVGKSPPTRAAGSAGCVGDVTDLDAWVFPAAETVPLAPAAACRCLTPGLRRWQPIRRRRTYLLHLFARCRYRPPLLRLRCRWEVMGVAEGGPRLPLKVGLLQFEALKLFRRLPPASSRPRWPGTGTAGVAEARTGFRTGRPGRRRRCSP